jgi:MATE family multidrug resistance protein
MRTETCNADDRPEDRTSYVSIWRLTWPQMLMMFVHFCIGFVDVLVAGRIGKEIQASLGLVMQCQLFCLILAVAVANAAVAALSQSLGACLYERTRRYVGLCLLLSVAGAGVILVVGLSFQDAFLTAIRVPEAIRSEAEYMYAVALVSLPAHYLLLITNAIFRAYKTVLVPLYSISCIFLVNTLGDFGFGLGLWGLPNYGYKGVIWATFFSVSAGALFNLLVLRRMRLLGRKTWPGWRWSRVASAYLFKVSWPAGAMHLLWQSGYLALFVIVSTLPAQSVQALAGLAAGLRIEAILFLPGMAFNMTASILVGHALGAGRFDLAKLAGYKILGAACAFLCVLGVGLWFSAEAIAGWLSPDLEVAAHTVSYLRYNVAAIPFTAAGMTLGGIMVGAGATIYNLLAMGACMWLIRLPLAYVLSHETWRAADGVWAAMLVSQFCQAVILCYLFQYKDWGRFSLRKSGNWRKRGLEEKE